MLIWRCDRCGTEAKTDQIVGKEFEYLKHGFGTLRVPLHGHRDLCKSCMKEAESAYLAATKAETKSLWDRTAELFRAA